MRSKRELPLFTTLEKVGLGLFALFMVLASAALVVQADLNAARQKLHARAELAYELLSQRVTGAGAVLTSLAGLHQASAAMTSTELTSIAEQLLAEYPHISQVTFLRWVSADRREAFERAMRREGFPQFAVRREGGDAGAPAGRWPGHLVVSFLEPLGPVSARILGLDLLGDPAVEAALERVVSGPGIAVFPAEPPLDASGRYLMLKPAYLGHYAPSTGDERREQLSGAFMLTLDVDQIVQELRTSFPRLRVVLKLRPDHSEEAKDFLAVPQEPLTATGMSALLPVSEESRTIPIGHARMHVSVSSRPRPGDVRVGLALLVGTLALVLAVTLMLGLRYRRVARREREASQVELFLERERAAVTLQSIGDGVITTDNQCQIQYMNPVAEKLTGLSTRVAQGQLLYEAVKFLHEDTRKPVEDPSQALRDCHDVQGEFMLVRHDGRAIAVDHTASPLTDLEGNTIGAVLVIRDVSRERELAQKLAYQANHDPLTGLPNRRAFEARLKEALESSRVEGLRHAVCYLDLDQFKLVNDTSGHAVGDQLLRQIAPLLATHMRDSDMLARLGGDEFGVLLSDCDMRRANEVAERLRAAIAGFRFQWEDKRFDIGVSIGVVPIDRHTGTITDALSAADIACYVAKDRGRNCIHAYESGDRVVADRHGEMEWLSRIQCALDEGRFVLYTQVIRPLRPDTRPFEMREFLLKMASPRGDLIPPMVFIPAAERYDLMPRLDRWVIEHAFAAVGRAGQEDGVLYTINLSGQSMDDADLAGFAIERMRAHAVQPEQVCFEITETAAISNFSEAKVFIARLRAEGCRFALDDFGAGLSSFGYLKHLPVNFLKVDGQFVRGILDDPVDRALVETINSIGHVMGIETIAEWVEDQRTLDALAEMGVDFAQGYHVGAPEPFEQASARPVLKVYNAD